LLRDFQAGKIDVLGNVARTEARQLAMDFSISHAYVHGVVFNRRDQPEIHTTADLTGKVIGVLEGSLGQINAQAHQGWGGTLRLFTAPQAMIDAVNAGTCDVALLIHGTENKAITTTYQLRRAFVDDIVHEFRFAVHKGDAAALARLNDALAAVRSNGGFERLYDQWIGPIEPRPLRLTDLRPYATTITLGALVIALIIWWQRHMLGRVSRQAQALRESEERFHRLVDSAFEGWVIHQAGRIVMVNPTFASTFGYNQTELIGKLLADLSTPEGHGVTQVAIEENRTAPYETVGLRKDGSQIPIKVAGQPCTFNGKPARIAAVHDLTAEKQAAADQLVLSKLESTGILAGGIAHDFNNFLAMLVLNIDMAISGLRPTDEAIRFLTAAKKAALSAKTLTQQLITFARGEASVRQPTDLAALLHKIVPLSLSGSNVRSEVTTAPDLRPAEIDPGQIERVFSNLVLNAREAMPNGGLVTVRAENAFVRAGDIPSLPAGDYVRVDLTDRGYGIPAEVMPKIFDPYFSTKRRGTQKGMGLGLTISHSIVQQHGGSLVAFSGVGVGTTFHVYLPVARQQVAPTPQVVAAITQPQSGRILVMDDEDYLRDIVRRGLEQGGYTVEAVADGKLAVESYAAARAAGKPFDAVLLDLTVRGGLGGLEALQQLRQIDPAVKAIVMSGYDQGAILNDFASQGFRAALPKPFELDALRATLIRVLAE
jgi:PAS domain S-box-containing protein